MNTRNPKAQTRNQALAMRIQWRTHKKWDKRTGDFQHPSKGAFKLLLPTSINYCLVVFTADRIITAVCKDGISSVQRFPIL